MRRWGITRPASTTPSKPVELRAAKSGDVAITNALIALANATDPFLWPPKVDELVMRVLECDDENGGWKLRGEV